MDRILIITKKKNGHRASSASLLDPFSVIFKHVFLVYTTDL